MNKQELRKELLEKRAGIPKDQRDEKNKAIAERLESLELFQEAYCVLFYVSFNNEVDTLRLIKEALGNEKQVAVPLIDGKDLQIKEITHFRQLKPGYKGILEPSPDLPDVSLEEINLVIVPGVAFDKKHYRLGYGGGYYDRLINKANTQPTTHYPQPPTFVGLSFEEQIVSELPTEAHDQKVDFIVTNKRII